MNKDQFKGRWVQFKGGSRSSGANLRMMICCKSKVTIKSSRELCKPNTATGKKR